ncbi:MAG: hypothetical protein HN976_26750 [Lentisphaerae bacterium]|nr:hypothetical protein [Lentisphaerota bacterium]
MLTVAGAALYGGAFGVWRSPAQMAFSMVKMPLMVLAVTVTTGLLSGMFAQVLGSGLSFSQVGMCILFGFSIMSILLGAVAPVAAFLSTQAVPPSAPAAVAHYRVLLCSHTAMVGVAGLTGYWRLYRLLVALTGDPAVARRVLVSWIAAAALAGTQLSWLLSPFLCRPDVSVTFFNTLAFESNFFEYLWAAACGHLPDQGG